MEDGGESEQRRKGGDAHLAKQLWIILHLGQGVEDVGEEHHGEALLLLGRCTGSVGRGAVVLAAPLVVKRQQLYPRARRARC